MKRRFKILLPLAFLLVLGFIFLLPHGGYRRKVEAYKKQLLAQGEKLTMLELAPPPSTNGSNCASALTNALNGFRLPADYPSTMKTIAPGVAMAGYINVPSAEMGSYGSNVAKSAELRAILQAPILDFKPDYSKGSDVPLWDHLGQVKAAETLLTVTATQALHEKDYPEAWSDLLAAVDLVAKYNNEPMLISDLVRIAMASIARSATWEALHSEHSWNESQLAELQAKWQGMDLFTHAETVMAMERAFGVDSMSKLRSEKDGRNLPVAGTMANILAGNSQATQTTEGWFGEVKNKAKELYDRYPRFWRWKSSGSYDEELYFLEVMSTAKAAVHRISVADTFVPLYNELLNDETNVEKLHPRAEKFFLVTPSGYYNVFAPYLLRAAWSETDRRLTVTALALNRYRLQHGSFPASLDDLVPAFLPRVPTDFMDGKPLRYKLKSDGDFLLYSVGDDGVDNGGDPTPTTSLTTWERGRDIVWPRAATPQEIVDYQKRQPTKTNSPVH